MPIGALGALGDVREKPLAMERIRAWQREFEVSTEAILLRAVKMTPESSTVFAASRPTAETRGVVYNIDYFNPSRSFPPYKPAGCLTGASLLASCTAIGAEAMGRERWPEAPRDFWVECVGVPPYPGHVYPRVVGFIRDTEPSELLERDEGIQYEESDALKPGGPGKKIVAFVVNDKARKWGGGFALAVRRHWPHVQAEFEREGDLRLGSVHWSDATDDVLACAMVAQHGYRPGPRPGIRYHALDSALSRLGSGDWLHQTGSRVRYGPPHHRSRSPRDPRQGCKGARSVHSRHCPAYRRCGCGWRAGFLRGHPRNRAELVPRILSVRNV